MSLESPNKANITIIDDKIYATDEDGKGLYSLVPPQMARYKGEGTLIDENFKLRKGLRKETIKRKRYNILWEELLNIVKRGN